MILKYIEFLTENLEKNVFRTSIKSIDYYQDTLIFKFTDKNLQAIQIENLDEPITVDIEKDNYNRIHINGIAEPLLGKGYGKIIYTKLLKQYGYISTVDAYGSSTEDAQRVWNSLINSGKYYSGGIGPFKMVSLTSKPVLKFLNNKKEEGYIDDYFYNDPTNKV